MIQGLLKKGMTRSEIVEFLVNNRIAPNKTEAEFMIAIDLGEESGDVIELDAQGNRVKSDGDKQGD